MPTPESVQELHAHYARAQRENQPLDPASLLNQDGQLLSKGEVWFSDSQDLGIFVPLNPTLRDTKLEGQAILRTKGGEDLAVKIVKDCAAETGNRRHFHFAVT